MKLTAVFTILVVVCSVTSPAESLWDPSFTGYLSGRPAVSVGDILFVQITAATSLSYESSRVDEDGVTIELSGGEAGNLLSFLPRGSMSGARSLRGREEMDLRTNVAVRVVSVDARGLMSVRGLRTVTAHGRTETLELSGVVDPRRVRRDGYLEGAEVADLRILYRSVLDAGPPLLGPEDVEFRRTSGPDAVEQVRSLGGGATAEAEPPFAGSAAVRAAERPPAVEAPGMELTVTDERRRELLLEYVNRLIDLVFR